MNCAPATLAAKTSSGSGSVSVNGFMARINHDYLRFIISRSGREEMQYSIIQWGSRRPTGNHGKVMFLNRLDMQLSKPLDPSRAWGAHQSQHHVFDFTGPSSSTAPNTNPAGSPLSRGWSVVVDCVPVTHIRQGCAPVLLRCPCAATAEPAPCGPAAVVLFARPPSPAGPFPKSACAAILGRLPRPARV
jgi:hypothetical protein